jgi:hypothetical protein
MDYNSISQATARSGYRSPTHPPHRPQPIPLQLRHPTSPDDDNTPLDPVSALIRAGEIVSNQGRQQKQLEQAQNQHNQHSHDPQAQQQR